MSFEYILEKDDSKLQLSEEQKSALIKNISSNFVSLNAQRSPNLDMASNLATSIIMCIWYY